MPPGSRKNKRLARFRETFFAECDELLVTFDDRLKQMASLEPNPEIIQEAYRAVHSIKGGSGVFGLVSVSELSQKMEAVLAQIRSEAIALDQPALDLLTVAFNLLKSLIERSKADEAIEEGEWQGMVESLDALLTGQGAAGPAQRMGPAETPPAPRQQSAPPEPVQQAPAPAPSPAPSPAPAEPEEDEDDDDDDFELFDDAPAPAKPSETWVIDFRPGPQLLRRGHEPLALIRELASLGTLRSRAISDDLPALAQLDPEICHLRWLLTLDTDKPKADIEEVFEFVEDDCQLTIAREADATPAAPAAPTPVAAPAPAATPTAAPAPAAARTTALATIAEAPQIEADHFAELLTQANTLMIQHQKLEARLEQMANADNNEEQAFLLVGMTNLGVALGQLQDGIAALSMVSASAVFEGLAKHLDAIGPGADGEVRLRTRADSVRVDRRAATVITGPVRELSRLLVHGRLTGSTAGSGGADGPAILHAWAGQRQGRLIARLSFDGCYLEPAALYRQAVLAGHLREDAGDGWQAADWILEPGIWDAPPPADGGSGLDLAGLAARLRDQGGTLEARIGKVDGLELMLSVPCERTVVDGLFIRHGSNCLGLPVNRVLATVRPDAAALQASGEARRMIDFRGSYLPLVFADRLLGLNDPAGDPEDWLVAIVETREGRNVGLVTHGVIGRRALPVMDLGRNLQPVEGLTGAVCLEEDRLALLLDPAVLSADVEAKEPQPVEDGAAPSQPMTVEGGGRILGFSLASERYGVAMADVRQVLSRRSIQRLPGSGRALLGAIPWNGMVLPVVDPTRGPRQENDTDKIERESLIVLSDGERYLAIPCDDRPRLYTLSETVLQPVPEAPMTVRRGLLGGIGNLDGRPVAVLEGPMLFREFVK